MTNNKYDCVVLDLDGSLIYSCNYDFGEGVKVTFINSHGEESSMWVHKRPGFDIFLKKCFENSKVGVWSMGQPGYVNAITKLFPEEPIFVYNWCNCDREQGRVFKRLNNIPYQGNIIMIDDREDVLEECDRVDTFIIPEWHPSQRHDTILFDLISELYNDDL